jgi:hypothetical protein
MHLHIRSLWLPAAAGVGQVLLDHVDRRLPAYPTSATQRNAGWFTGGWRQPNRAKAYLSAAATTVFGGIITVLRGPTLFAVLYGMSYVTHSALHAQFPALVTPPDNHSRDLAILGAIPTLHPVMLAVPLAVGVTKLPIAYWIGTGMCVMVRLFMRSRR